MGKKEPETEKKVYDGGRFIAYKKLIEITTRWQQREKLCEDVDYLEEIGGPAFLYDKLETSLKTGIKSETVDERINAFGTNEPPKAPVKSCPMLFLEALNDLTLIILIVAAVVSTIINLLTADADHRRIAFIEAGALLGAVVISGGVQAVNDYQKEKQFRELNETALKGKKVTVIRDSKETEVQISKVVVGDVVKVRSGDEVAGDAVLLKGSSVLADESAMTGESMVLHKEDLARCIEVRDKIISQGNKNTADHHDVPSAVLMSGTNIQNGSGLMMIVAVGKESSIGKIQETVTDKGDDSTPLQRKLDRIARDIGIFGLISAVITLIVIVIRAIIDAQDGGWGSDETDIVIQGFLVAITVVVVAVPEGLPLAVTLSLAFSVKKMLDEHNLVRKLHACETMGSARVICSDKTGTLTLNKMFMTHFWNLTPRQVYNYETGDHEQIETFVSEPQLQIFRQVTCCNSTADPKNEKGNPTELAIVKYMYECGTNAVSMRDQYEKVDEEPFSSDRKRMSTLIRDDDGRQVMLVKGASELILDTCEDILDLQTGKKIAIDEAVKEDVSLAITEFAKQSLRTIGFAYKHTEAFDKERKDDNGVLEVEKSGLTLVGICGIKDVIRPDVPGAVADCNKAGISVKMVTGDNLITARAIAKECNIISSTEEDKDDAVMLGKDFFERVGGYEVKEVKGVKEYTVKNGEVFDKLHKDLKVLARSRPEDKLTLVVGLRERGQVVAVTGDGTNDAPALSKANVGFAMGITGTEIAKQAADILLMDDNFSTIVNAVKWGRNIYDSIRKFLQFQLTVNFVSVLITVLSAGYTKEAVLSAVQMLWVNLIMDTLASLALATEPPSDELLNRPPNSPKESMVNKKMTKHVVGQGIYQLIVLLVFLFLGTSFLPEEIDDDQRNPDNSSFVRSGLLSDNYSIAEDGPSRHYTYIFNVFVMMTVFNFISARKLNDEINIFEGITKSCYFPVIVVTIFILQAVIVSFGGVAFRSAQWGVGPIGWLICIGFGILGNVVNLLLKLINEEKICCTFGKKEISEKDRFKMSSLSLRSQLSLRPGRKNSVKEKGYHKD